MVDTGADENNIFWYVDQIQIADIHHQAHGYFGLLVIGNVVNQFLTNPLVVSDLKNLANYGQEVQNFYEIVR